MNDMEKLAEAIAPLTLDRKCNIDTVLCFDDTYFIDAYLKSGYHVSISNSEPYNFKDNLVLEIWNFKEESHLITMPLTADDVLTQLSGLSDKEFQEADKCEQLAFYCRNAFGPACVQLKGDEEQYLIVSCDGGWEIAAEQDWESYPNFVVVAWDESGDEYGEFHKENLSLQEALSHIIDTRAQISDYMMEMEAYYQELEAESYYQDDCL